MQGIINISKTNLNSAEVNSVNAREIHEYLEVKTAFSHWIKRAIEKYDFIEQVDYVWNVTDVKSGKRDFFVSMDMAKELSMLENNPKGKEARKYFIEAEKQLNTPLTYEQIMQNALLLADKRVKELETKIEVDKPLVSFAQTVSSAVNSVLIRDWAKSIGLTEKSVREWLRSKNYLYKNPQGKWCLYATETAKKYFEAVATTHDTPTGKHISYTIRITGAGQTALTDRILADINQKGIK